jgi:RNA ligase (TIGR02306 family)
MRSLAHVEKIISIEPIEGKDRIQKAKILGWELLVGKDEFKVGELCCYTEIDSILPIKPEFEHLRQRCWSEKYQGFRIKTLKFNKTLISQGIAFPLSILPPAKYKEGQDVSEIIGVKSYDPESLSNSHEYKQNKFLKFLLKYSFFRKMILPFIQKEKGNWPQWIIKTDETRVQSIGYNSLLTEYAGQLFYICEKYDGSSATFFYKKSKNIFQKGMFGVCSRNIWLKTPDNSAWWEMARKYKIEDILKNRYKQFGNELTIQGEIIGPRMNGNKYKLTEVDFYVFNIIDHAKNYHFDYEEMKNFCNEHGLKTVKLLDSEFKLPLDVKEMINYAKGKSFLNKDILREGVVIRRIIAGKKEVSFKSINNEFLLKYDE